jgi:hypothetical protein
MIRLKIKRRVSTVWERKRMSKMNRKMKKQGNLKKEKKIWKGGK